MAKPINPDLGSNIGHSIGAADWSTAKFDKMLDDLEFNHGCKKIRFNIISYDHQVSNTTIYQNMMAAIQTALNRGFDVMGGLTAGGLAALTQATYTGAMKNALVAMATTIQGWTYTGTF